MSDGMPTLALAPFLAALASAFLYAIWNAWVKSRGDANGAVAAIVIGAAFPNLIVLGAFGLPASPAWGWIGGAVVLSVVALMMLASAYREGDFAVAFPIIRGLIPLLLTLAAVPLFGEVPTPFGVLGVCCVSCALVLIAWESARRSRTMTLRGLGIAMLAALFTAASVIIDAKGARLGANPLGYAATIAVLNGAVMAALQTLRGHSVPGLLRRHWPIAVFGALVSSLSYQLYVWALMQAPVALVSALRETSMLFALLIAALWLGERIGGWRLIAVGLMALGAMMMRF